MPRAVVGGRNFLGGDWEGVGPIPGLNALHGPSEKAGEHLPMIRTGTPILSFLPVDQLAAALLHYLQAIGPWGPLVLGAVYVLATVLMIPGGILGIMAGFAFGLVVGTVMYVDMGSAMRSVAEVVAGRARPSPAQGVLSGVGLAATIAVVILMGRIAKKALRDAAEHKP